MPSLLVFTPTFGDHLRRETVDSVAALTFGGTLTHEIGRFNPYGDGDLRNVTAQYQRARDIFLDGDWDALLTVEHDMVVSGNAAQKLWDDGAGVVYGVYLLRQGLMLNARSLDGTFYRDKPLADAAIVSGVGLGCTLIRRAVLEAVEFRQDDTYGTCDVPFAEDCRAAGIAQIARFDVACGHILDNLILLPYRDAETGMVQAWRCAPGGTDDLRNAD